MQPNCKTGYAEVNGIKMYYEIHGEGGIPLVLIHGGGSDIYVTFGRVLPLLALTRQVIGVELQGHGHTSHRTTPSSFEQDADDVAALLIHLNITKADIFGFSNGGSAALQIAIRHAGLVNKLVVASAFFKRDGMYPWFWDFMMKTPKLESMPQPLKDAYLAINPNPADLQTMHNNDAKRMQNFTDWPENLLKNIQAPTLLLFGDADIMTPEHAVEMYRLIPQARLTILPSGHADYIGELLAADKNSKLPAVTVTIVEAFLDGE